jgi:biotin transport system substrate-specific component
MTYRTAPAAATTAVVPGWKVRAVSLLVAVGLVAVSAQIVVPVPGTPVPMTLQPLAVLIVGGLLGARLGAAALALYLLAGVAGLPVFAGGGAGLARLMGPTGGYLLAFPAAAAVTGAVAWSAGTGAGQRLRMVAGAVLGLAVIHAGGAAHLALLGGDPALAIRVGVVPFLLGDLIKVGLAVFLVQGLRSRLPFGR